MTENMTQFIKKINSLVPGDIDTKILETPDLEAPMNLLIIGTPQQNLFGIINEMLGNLDELDTPMMSGYHCTIVGGECKSAIMAKDDNIIPMDLDTIATQLRKYNKNSSKCNFTITLNTSILDNCRITVIASDSDYEDINWNKELSLCDILLFTMSSTALFSLSERKVLRTWIMSYMGDKVSIILTNNNLILEEDQKDIQESLENMFHGRVVVFRLPETDIDNLRMYVENSKNNLGTLREDREKRKSRIILEEAQKAIELQIKVLSEGNDELNEIIDDIQQTATKLPDRQKAACRRSRMQYTIPSKLEVSEMISNFDHELEKRLEKEIENGSDVDKLRDILPSYIGDAWKRESDVVLEITQAKMFSMQRELQLYIEKDIRNYIEVFVGANKADYIYALTDKYINLKDSFKFNTTDSTICSENQTDYSKMKYYGVIATGIALVVFSHPIVGLTVATLGSRKVKQENDKLAQAENKKALIEASNKINGAYYDDMTLWLDSLFATVEENIDSCIEECYQKMIDAIIKALNAKKEDKSSYNEKLTELNIIKEEIVNYITSCK